MIYTEDQIVKVNGVVLPGLVKSIEVKESAQIDEQEIKVLKDATLNNMTNNVFLINFDSVDSVAITSGIYDPVARKLYV